MKRLFLILAVLILLTAGGFGTYYYFEVYRTDSGERVSSSGKDAVYAEKVSAVTGNGITARYGGKAVAQATLEVPLDSERTLKECYVKEGQKVQKGDPLFSYDSQEEEDKIAQDEIDIEKNRMNIESAQAQIQEQEKLQESAANEKDREQARLSILSLKNEIASYEYEIEKTELEIESLKESVEDSVVAAEDAGTVQSIADPNGDEQHYSDEGSTYLTILADGDLRIEASVSELAYDRIYEGMEMAVFSRTDENRNWKGTVTEISGDKDKKENDDYDYYGTSGSSTYTFYVTLDSDEGLLPGEHVYLEADEGQTEVREGLWLPEDYILEDDGSSYVWLASKSNRIEKRKITCGEFDAETKTREILDGLKMYDYIAYPMGGIKEGLPVRYSDLTAVSEEYDSIGYSGSGDFAFGWDDSDGWSEDGEDREDDYDDDGDWDDDYDEE